MDIQPVLCGFPGAGHSISRTFVIGKPERYQLWAFVPIDWEAVPAMTRFESSFQDQTLKCDLQLSLRSVSGGTFEFSKHIQTMSLHAWGSDLMFSRGDCMLDLPAGTYKVNIKSGSTVPEIVEKGGFLTIQVFPKGDVDIIRGIVRFFGVALAIIGFGAYAISEANSK